MIKKITLCLCIAAFAFGSCQQKEHANDTAKNLSPADTLSYEIAVKYVKNYAKRAGTVDSVVTTPDRLQRIIKMPDSRCVWFGIDRLEELVKKVKAEGGDGIRFYYSTYDSTYKASFKGHIPARQYWGYNTLIMVSTKDSLKQFHQDYYYAKPTGNPTGIATGFIVGTVPENRGEQCPPPANCYSIGATLITP